MKNQTMEYTRPLIWYGIILAFQVTFKNWKIGHTSYFSIYVYSSNKLCYTFIEILTLIKYKSERFVLLETEASSLHYHRGISSCKL